MKSSALRTHVYVPLVAINLLGLFLLTSKAAHIPAQGLHANAQGVAGFQVTNAVAGVEPVAVGHRLSWLENAVFQSSGINTQFFAYYYLGWAGHDGILAGADTMFTLQNPPAGDFPSLVAALPANGLAIGDLKTEFGILSLGADQQGSEWDYDAGAMVENRVYRGGGVVIKVNGHAALGGALSDLLLTNRYNVLTDFNDDQVHGATVPMTLTNMSAGAPASVQAVATAFLQDLGPGGQVRFVFDSIQSIIQNEFSDHQNARVGAIFDIQNARIEAVPGPPLVEIGDVQLPEGNNGDHPVLMFPVNVRNAPPGQPVQVDWVAAAGTAAAASDFVSGSGTLTIPAGSAMGQIMVTINGDVDLEPDETVTVTLSNSQGAQLGRSVGTGTIVNDDGHFISIRGVHAEDQGSVAWNAGAGSLEGGPSPTHQQPDGGMSFYWFASPDYDNIVPASPGGGHGENPVSGFGATLAALRNNGASIGDLLIQFGPANLGGHVAGVDYNLAGSIETRRYQGAAGSSYRILLGNEVILTAPMPDVNMTLDFGNLGTPNDDVITGVTTAFTPLNASAGASPAAQAVAAALMQDISQGQLRSVFLGIQPITQTGLNANGRTGAFFSAPVGRLELLAGPPLGQPELLALDAVADEGAGALNFDVRLSPPAAQQVTVNYHFTDDSANLGSDYHGAAGTLTFAAGETNKTVSVTVVDDAEVEINEQLLVSLSNANGAPIHRAQATGVILDNDFPDFPPIDPEFYPTNTPCICTPLAGIYRTNASEIWHMKLLGAAGLLRVAAVAVSTNDPSIVEALVYNTAGTLVGSNQVSYTVPELAASGDMNYTKWVDINITNQPAGETLRIEVRNLPPTPQTQTHYRLHGAGVRWMSTPSPSFAGFEAEETRWRFLVRSNEHLMLNYFTNNLPGVGPVDYHLIDPLGSVVQSGSNAPIVFGNEIVVSNAAPGLWTLAMRSLDHYRIAKVSGLDRNIYADWRTASHSDLTVKVRLDGTNAVGASFDVVLDRLNTFGGVTNLAHYRSQLTSNSWAHFMNVQQGIYRISVNPQMAGVSVPAPQFEILACDHPLTNCFDSVSGGGTNQPPTGPPPIINLLPGAVVEADAGQTNHLMFTVKLSRPSPVAVAAEFATQNGAAHAGSDFVQTVTTVVFDPGVTMTNVVVPVIGDAVEEQRHERFNATLFNATNGLIGRHFANAVIVDNDGSNAAPEIAFVVADGAIYEGDAGVSQIELPVLLTRPAGAEVRVDYSTRNNSATEPSDYQAAAGTLVFAPGTVMQTVSVSVNGDVDVEPEEFFWLDLSNPVNAVIDSNADIIGAGHILNDDQEGGQPAGSALYALNGMARETDITNTVLHLDVVLWPPSTNTVSVVYGASSGSATVGVDFAPGGGLLTFPPGSTNQSVAITVMPDEVFEPTEFLRLTLGAATNAAIAQPESVGVIKDDDRPDYPGDNDDPLPFPSVASCVCTPLAGQYETNLPQAWVVRSLGGPMDMRLYGVSVNTNDGATIQAKVYDSSGALISSPSVTYSSAEAAAGGLGYEKWVDVSLGIFAPGDILRVEVSLGAGTPPTQTHYRLRFCGARWVATSSPSFAGFEDDSALWRLRVDPFDTHLNLDFFTTNTPTAATAMEYELYRPDGSVASSSSSLSIVPGDEISITNPMAGLWALRCNTTMHHYRLSKSGGVDNALYLGWRGASWASLSGIIELNGSNAVGASFDVTAHYQFRVNGVLTNFPLEMQVTTNGMFHFDRVQHGQYIVTVSPQSAGITTPPAQTNLVVCDEHEMLTFRTFGGGGSPLIFAPDLVFHEADTNRTGFFDIFLTAAAGTDVTVNYSTGGGTASAGSDYVSTSGVATITAGATNTTVGVVIVGNNAFELPKTFHLNLSGAAGATLAEPQTTATILDDDRPLGARFHRIMRVQNGGPFRLEFNQGDNGAVYEIQASDNLRQWIPIGQVTGSGNGMFEFTDGDSTNRVRRYYRAIAP